MDCVPHPPCGLFPDHGWKPCPQQCKFRVLTTGLPGNSQVLIDFKSWYMKHLCGSKSMSRLSALNYKTVPLISYHLFAFLGGVGEA